MLSGISWVMVLAGPTVVGGYVLTSFARSWIIGDGARRFSASTIEASTVILVAALAWLLIRSQAPGRTVFQNPSAVGFLSSQVLTAWASVALWTGLAGVCGHAVPFRKQFRHGSSGIVGALALLVAFFPITALVAVGAWVGSMAVSQQVRPALALAYVSTMAAEWLLGILDPHGPWGLVHGPESTLFVAVLAGLLLARWTVGDVGLVPATESDSNRPDGQ